MILAALRSLPRTVYKCVLKMNTINDTALINLVQKYPLLYDLSSPLYNDHQKKEEAWNEISVLTSASAYECKIKWTRLRDNYRKALIIRNRNSGRAKGRAVKYENQLSFLNEKFSFTPRKRNILALDPIPGNGQNTEEPKVKVVAVESSPVLLEHVKAAKRAVSKPVTVHELNAFFDSIAETVKTFPKKIQVQLKNEIFKLVNHTEASLVENKNAVITYFTTESSMPKNESKMNTDSPRTTTEYTEYPSNPFQTTDAAPPAPEQYINIQVKEEYMN